MRADFFEKYWVKGTYLIGAFAFKYIFLNLIHYLFHKRVRFLNTELSYQAAFLIQLKEQVSCTSYKFNGLKL
ncbi:hypothetical protein GCM10007199_10900 [Fictibacillus barbaricus]|nr:hypothetical protein GCM10007199_10900 [Fictibacillus barbaricus]